MSTDPLDDEFSDHAGADDDEKHREDESPANGGRFGEQHQVEEFGMPGCSRESHDAQQQVQHHHDVEGPSRPGIGQITNCGNG